MEDSERGKRVAQPVELGHGLGRSNDAGRIFRKKGAMIFTAAFSSVKKIVRDSERVRGVQTSSRI